MPHYVFARLKNCATKRVNCSVCGRKINRQRTFMQTDNPWNKDPGTGMQRTREQIRVALDDEARAWRQEPERCYNHGELTEKP